MAHQRYNHEVLATYCVKTVLSNLGAGKWKFGTRIASSDHGIQIDRNCPGNDSASFLIRSLTCSLSSQLYQSNHYWSNYQSINLYPHLKTAHNDDAPTL